jgi:hypothetical protein
MFKTRIILTDSMKMALLFPVELGYDFPLQISGNAFIQPAGTHNTTVIPTTVITVTDTCSLQIQYVISGRTASKDSHVQGETGGSPICHHYYTYVYTCLTQQ